MTKLSDNPVGILVAPRCSLLGALIAITMACAPLDGWSLLYSSPWLKLPRVPWGGSHTGRERDFRKPTRNHDSHSDLGSAACQPSAEAGAGPVAERARVDEFDAVGRPRAGRSFVVRVQAALFGCARPEGQRVEKQGMHQHNFFVKDGEFFVQRRNGGSVSIRKQKRSIRSKSPPSRQT